MEDGPRISTDYEVWVEARDRVNGRVLLGGLGAFGAGTMWAKESPTDRNLVGYGDAREQDSSGSIVFGETAHPDQ